MYSYGPPHMAGQKQDVQLEHTYRSYVRIRDAALKTCQRRWTTGRSDEIGSGISVLAARHDEDDDDICIFIVIHWQTFVVPKLFSVVKHARFSKLGSKPCWLIRQRKRRNFKRLCIPFVLFTCIRLTATESSIHSKSLALCELQPLLPSLESSSPRRWVSIYIYIYIEREREREL